MERYKAVAVGALAGALLLLWISARAPKTWYGWRSGRARFLARWRSEIALAGTLVGLAGVITFVLSWWGGE
jgi:hypothetical protein